MRPFALLCGYMIILSRRETDSVFRFDGPWVRLSWRINELLDRFKDSLNLSCLLILTPL
jgi:hypothetical protein